MANFFAFISDGNGNVFYFNAEQRWTQETPDSHKTIKDHFLKDELVNEYGFVCGQFNVYEINTKDDSEQVEKWIQSFYKTVDFYNMCFGLVCRDGTNLGYVPEDIIGPAICHFAIRECGYALFHVPEKLITPEICKLAVRQCGGAFLAIPKNMITPELCELAVRQNGDVLFAVPENLRTPELCEIAVKQCSHALAHVPENLRTLELYKLAEKHLWGI